MKLISTLSLATLISTASIAGVANAQMAPATIPANDGVSVVYITPLSDSESANTQLPLRILNPASETVADAQNEISSDPNLLAALETRNVQLNNVVAIDTAGNGGKIVYVR